MNAITAADTNGNITTDARGRRCIVTLDEAAWTVRGLAPGAYVIVEAANGDVAAGEVALDHWTGDTVVHMEATIHTDRVVVRQPRRL